MDTNNYDDDDDPSLLSAEDVIRLAADRGVTLRLETSPAGNMYFTDGRKKYVTPPDYLPGDGLPTSFVESLCSRYNLPRLDFALDPKGEDD